MSTSYALRKRKAVNYSSSTKPNKKANQIDRILIDTGLKDIESESEECHLVLEEDSHYPFTYIKKSHKVGCSECRVRNSGHTMRKQIRLCKCNNVDCFI